MSMSCPRCQVLLCEVTSAGVVADACGTCRGVWLDRGELEEMVARVDRPQHARRNATQYAGTKAGVTTQTEGRTSRTGQTDFLRCPRCGDLLRETQHDGVRVDECRRCRGMWLDDGELERIKAHLRGLRHDWERDEKERGGSIRWGRPLRYPRHHPNRHLAPSVPPREPHRDGQFPRPFRHRGQCSAGTSDPVRSPDGARPDESLHGRGVTDVRRRHSVLGKVWHACRPAIGTLLIILGFVLMFVPVLPGTPLLLIGMAVAGSSHPIVRFLRERWRRWRRRGLQDPSAVT